MSVFFLGGLFRRSYPTGTERDVAYGPDPEHLMDIYHPSTRPNGKVIFMVHGGGGHSGDKANDGVVTNKVAYWVPKGYTFISINYRLEEYPFAQAQDMARALAFAQSKARSWGADPKKFILMGHSAGSHLVALFNTNAATRAGYTLMPWLGSVLLDSAALNVTKIMTHGHASFYDDWFGTDPDLWDDYDPYLQLDEELAPLFMVYSSQRGSNDEAATREFADKAEGFYTSVTILPQNLPHGDINNNLGIPNTDYTTQVDKFIGSL